MLTKLLGHLFCQQIWKGQIIKLFVLFFSENVLLRLPSLWRHRWRHPLHVEPNWSIWTLKRRNLASRWLVLKWFAKIMMTTFFVSRMFRYKEFWPKFLRKIANGKTIKRQKRLLIKCMPERLKITKVKKLVHCLFLLIFNCLVSSEHEKG